jgi:hypothetical protein
VAGDVENGRKIGADVGGKAMNAEELELAIAELGQLDLQVEFAIANKIKCVAVKSEVLKSLVDAYKKILESELERK